MTSEIVAASLVLAGAILLTIGPALQALHELSPYNDILKESPLAQSFTDTLPDWVRLALSVTESLPFTMRWTPTIVEGSGRILRGLLWVREQRAKLDTIETDDEREKWRAYLNRMDRGLTVARNWLIVTLGATLATIGATVELVTRIVAEPK